MLGLVHLEMGREEEAIADYESLAAAAASEQERAEHLAVLAELHYSMGNLELLESLCRELISADIPDERGDQPYTPKEKAYFLLGDGYGQQKNLDGLVATYREALDKYPDSYYAGDMRFALGQALFDSGDLVGASEVLESYLQGARETLQPAVRLLLSWLRCVQPDPLREGGARLRRVGHDLPRQRVGAGCALSRW